MAIYGIDENGKNKVKVVRAEDSGWIAIDDGSLGQGTVYERYKDGIIWIRANEFEEVITPLSGDQGIMTKIGQVSTPYIPDYEMRMSVPVYAPNTGVNVDDATLIVKTDGSVWIRSKNFEPGLIENQTLWTTFCVGYPDNVE